MRNPFRKPDCRSGFTMVEIALALLVAAIGLMGIFALFPAGLSASRAAKDDSRVALLAESILSDMRMRLDENFNTGLSGYGYRYQNRGQTLSINGSTDTPTATFYETNPVTGGDGDPLAGCNLTVRVVNSRMLEIQLECWPGLQTERKKIFYTRVVNRSAM